MKFQKTCSRCSILVIGICFFTLLAATGHAQGRVRVRLVDDKDKPLQNATVLIISAKDSSLVKGGITGEAGDCAFEQVKSGTYLLMASYSGLKPVYSTAFEVKDTSGVSIQNLKLSEKEILLQDVTVAVKKPVFEQKPDRLIINVASSITSTGSTALEVLMRSPGVVVDQQNSSISINGKNGVVIMMNGKISRMPLPAVIQLLSGMSSANIERIELITTPPANFDAEGNAGFINIVMKTNPQLGTNGSMSASAGYGFGAGSFVAGSGQFNHRKSRMNLYGDYSFTRISLNSLFIMNREVAKGTAVIASEMNSIRDDFRRMHNGRIGLDLELTKKTTLGLLASGFGNMYAMEAINTSRISVNNKLDTMVVMNNPEKHPLDNYSTNINLSHQYRPDQFITVNLDYISYRDANKLTYENNFYDADGSFLYLENAKTQKTTPIQFWVSAADFNRKFSKAVSAEGGIKSTVSHFQNNVLVERQKLGAWVRDPEFSANYRLNESIYAAYTLFNMQWGEKTSVKTGLRYEYTLSNLGSDTKNNIVDRRYGNWFPSFFLSRKVDKDHTFNFSYNRRITRPTFNDMAPFVYFVDPNTLFSGNPALQPATSNNGKLDFVRKQMIFSFSYTHEKNSITNFSPRVDPATNKQTLAAENQKNRKIAFLSFAAPLTISSYWKMQNNLSAQWQQLHAVYQSNPLKIRQKNFTANTTQTFTLPKSFTIELIALYQSGGLFGIYRVRSIHAVNAGIQKKLNNNSGTLRLAINNITGPPHIRFSIREPQYNLVFHGDMRFVNTNIRFTYARNFGSDKVKAARKRALASEEERKRVQSN